MISSKKRIFDVFLFFNELDLLELRLKTLYPIVDYFIITELCETFSGNPKELLFNENKERFKEFSKKMIYNPVSSKELQNLKNKEWEDYISDFNISLAHKHKGRPAKNIQSSLKREITHRDSCILGFFNLASPNDIILLSDLDEIPNPNAIKEVIKKPINSPYYFKMDWYLYWINNKVSDPWFGTVLFDFKYLKGKSLDNLRLASSNQDIVPGEIVDNGGWHFSYLGGSEAIRKKLNAHPFQGYKVQIARLFDKLKIRSIKATIQQNKDFLFQGRKLHKVNLDETYPKELLKNPNFIKKFSCK
tara:strand:- start:56 stop:964 length:909 start_codon:yes stop_codon:yes gene_type:complete